MAEDDTVSVIVVSDKSYETSSGSSGFVGSDEFYETSSTFAISGAITTGGSITNSMNVTLTLSFLSSRMNVIRYKPDLMLEEPPFLMSSQSIEV